MLMATTETRECGTDGAIGAYRGGRKEFVNKLIGHALGGFHDSGDPMPRIASTKHDPISSIQEGRQRMQRTHAIRKKMEHGSAASRYGAEMALSQLKELHDRATKAESRSRMIQSRYDGLVMERESLERELVHCRSAHALCKQEMAVLEVQLDRMKHKYESNASEETSTTDTVAADAQREEESTRNDDDDVGTLALARQIAALRAQLESVTRESDKVKGQLQETKESLESLQDTHEALERRLEETACDAEAYRVQYQQARDALQSMTEENASLSDTISHLEDEIHEIEISRASYKDDAHALEQHKKALEEQVQHSVKRIAYLEEQLTFMNGVFDTQDQHSKADTVDDDALEDLRNELHEREQALASTQESLVEEKQRSSALHEQVLKQSMEIEDLRRDRVRAQQLQHDLHALKSVHAETLERLAHAQLQQDNDQDIPPHVQEILDEKNSTIMQLEGRLRQLQQNDSWLM
ncbi:hypothetical protein M9435_002286 [Picochlorum sp. BPE23]|nr:hypothetical protein M9435_002286 [Picochlorum sp. BPE23]